MWLVQTLLFDHWFDDLNEAFCFYEASPKTRTYPRLEDWNGNKGVPFSHVYK